MSGGSGLPLEADKLVSISGKQVVSAMGREQGHKRANQSRTLLCARRDLLSSLLEAGEQMDQAVKRAGV